MGVIERVGFVSAVMWSAAAAGIGGVLVGLLVRGIVETPGRPLGGSNLAVPFLCAIVFAIGSILLSVRELFRSMVRTASPEYRGALDELNRLSPRGVRVQDIIDAVGLALLLVLVAVVVYVFRMVDG
jgi:hypothetical protein